MQMKQDLYKHCLEIAHATGLTLLDPAKFPEIIEIVEAEDYPKIAAVKICKLVGALSTPRRMEDVELAVTGDYVIPE